MPIGEQNKGGAEGAAKGVTSTVRAIRQNHPPLL